MCSGQTLLCCKRMNEYQVENGQFTRIVNKALEDLVGAKLSGLELAICIFIIRKTWGFQKKSDEISISQFQEATHCSRQAVMMALKSLQLGKKITLVSKGKSVKSSNVYAYNKYWRLGNSTCLDSTQLGKQTLHQLGKQTCPTKEIERKNTLTHSPIGETRAKNMGKIRGYDENQFYSEKVVNMDGEVVAIKPKGEKDNNAHLMRKLIAEAEKKRGAKFVNMPKQFAALKKLRIAGINLDRIRKRWDELERDDFWKDKLDFWAVANSFDKKP